MGPESDRPDLPREPLEPEGPRVGVDEWVASADRLQDRPTGVAGALRRAGEVVTPPIQLAIFAGLAATVPFWLGTGDLFTYGIFVLLYVLLGLGLNTIVGFAGLLDLGYVAFFGFGAYFYAILSSDHYGIHWPAIVTVPLPLLDPPGDEPAALRFTPRLDDKLAAARLLRMGQVVKVVVGFRGSFWRTIDGLHDVQFIHVFGRPLPTWWMPLDPEVPRLTGWAGGPHAARLAGKSLVALKDLAVRSLSDALGLSPGDVAPQLESLHLHDWTSDPLSRGAYTYVGVGGSEAYRTLGAPVANTLFFAGEATCGGGHNATMEGALRSGRRAATELLAR